MQWHLDHRIGGRVGPQTTTMSQPRSANCVTDWRSLGTLHKRRDEADAALAQVQVERDAHRSTTALARWPAIVAAIRAIAAAYNEGIGRDRLVIAEQTADRQHPSVTVESTSPANRALIVTLDQAELRVNHRVTQTEGGGVQRWVDLSRTDAATAAYVLQDWIERL